MSARACRTVVMCGVLAMPATLAADCGRTVARIEGGSAEAVTTVGDLAVIAAGPRLAVYDLTDPSEPVLMGETTGDGQMRTMVSVGPYVLTVAKSVQANRIDIVDVSDPTNPTTRASVPVGRAPLDMVVEGDHVWVVTDFNGLGFGLGDLDLSDPRRPVVGELVSLTGSASNARAAIDGNLVYVAIDGSGLHIVDVADPDAPERIGFLELGLARAVAVDDDLAFVSTAESPGVRVHVIDVNEPKMPIDVSSFPVPYDALPGDIALAGTRLYVGMIDAPPFAGGATALNSPSGAGGLVVFDVSDPADPRELSVLRFSAGVTDVVFDRDLLVAADADRGLRVFDVSQAGDPLETSRRNITSNNVFSMAVEGDLAFVGDQGLRIFSVADPLRPEFIGSLEHDDETLSVAVGDAGITILTAGSGGTISVIDGANPFQPREVSRLQTGGEATDAAILRSLGAVADGSEGLLLLDLEHVGFPSVIATTRTSGAAVSVALWDDLAVVGLADPAPGIAVFEISDPTQPELVGQLPLPSEVVAVAVRGDLAAAVTEERIHFVDLTDPAALVWVGSYDIVVGLGMDVALTGDRALVANYPGNLLYLDIDDPADPVGIDRHLWWPMVIPDGPPLGGWEVAVYDGLGVVADGGFGLRIVDFGNCRRMQPSPPPPSAVD